MTRALDVPAPFRLEQHARVGSTNDEALARARNGDSGRLWIVAREQDAGRGRHSRSWASPKGNLYASLLLVDPAPEAIAPQLGFVAGVALATAVSEILRHDRRLALKWPNDLLFARAKVAGVLLEGARLANGRFACVIGFGVNCVSHPAGLSYPAFDLSAVARPVEAAEVFSGLAEKMAEWMDVWDAGRGFARVRETWMSFAAGLQERIELRTAHERLEGVFRGLDPEGRLMLDVDSNQILVEAGDVFLQSEFDHLAQGPAAP